MSTPHIPEGFTPDPLPTLEARPWLRAGISRSLAYDLIRAGNFPRPVKIGKAARFVSAEVSAWITARIGERDSQAARKV